ncbi:MAG TPA: phosphodiester glycosidase family protein [Treponemataceae bacterium]|nr:phosphodiester glycosidase family protein [Treponemataceae bacterium]
MPRLQGGAVLLILPLFFVFFCVSCATQPAVPPDILLLPPASFEPSWEEIAPGVALSSHRVEVEGLPLALYCLRADLSEPGVSLLATPPRSPDAKGASALLERTSVFAERLSLAAAVNATPFYSESYRSGVPATPSGLWAAGGTILSPARSKYAALVIPQDGFAHILSPAEASVWVPSPGDDAAGGFSLLLRLGSPVPEHYASGYDRGRSARTAAATSAGGRYFYAFVADGKNAAFSVGLTFHETALWLLAFGAEDALMLDGGGSSALAVRRDRSGVSLVNSPVQFHFSGIERPVAVHIGIRSR